MRLPGAKVNYVEVRGKEVEEGRYSRRRKKRVKDCEELRNRAAVSSIQNPSEQRNCNLDAFHQPFAQVFTFIPCNFLPDIGVCLPLLSTFLYLLPSISASRSHIRSHWSQMKGLGFDEVWEESASSFLMNVTSKPVQINGNIV